jgi:hypothetical protein
VRSISLPQAFLHRTLLPILLGLALLVSPVAGQDKEGPPQPPAITPQDLVRLVKKGHPRLLLDESQFGQLRRLIKQNPQAAEWYAAKKREANRLIVESPCTYKLSGGTRLLGVSRAVLNRVYTLALLYKLEGGSRYLHRLWEDLEAAARFPDWHPRHFLDTAEMTHAFAIAYDWLYAAWSEPQKRLLHQAIIEKGLKPALEAYGDQKKTGWWAASPYNWNQVVNGGIGMGALAVLSEAPEVAAPALEHALRSLPLALARLNPDGASYEGPLYWGYGTFYTCVFLAALESALGSDFGLGAGPGLAATGLFPLYVTGPTGKAFNYADSTEKIPWLSQLYWLARKFKQPVAAGLALRSASPHALDLLWRDFAPVPPPEGKLPLDKYFQGAEVVTLRSSWQDDRGMFVAMKAGDNRAGHAHLDLGTFVLDALGERWAVDLGPDDYNLPGYFDSGRWDYYRVRAEGHNTLVINPGAGPDQDPEASARITRFHSSPQRSFAIADLTPAYAREASKVWRGLALVDRNRVLIQDEIETRKPGEVWWLLHTLAAVHLTPDRRTAVLSQNSRQLQVRLLHPDNATFEVSKARPLPLSPHPLKQGDNQGVQKLSITLRHAQNVRLVVGLAPLPAAAACAPKDVAAITPLSDW